MAQSAKVLEFKTELQNKIAEHVNLSAIGNSNRSMKDIAIDLIHESKMPYSKIAEGCFLCDATIKNLADEETRYPRYDTIERIFRFFNMRMDLQGEPIKARFLNKAKED